MDDWQTTQPFKNKEPESLVLLLKVHTFQQYTTWWRKRRLRLTVEPWIQEKIGL